MADFFISYNSADADTTAEIATVLKDAGYKVKFAGWEIKPGTKISTWMRKATNECDRMLAICSPDYFKAEAKYSGWERDSYAWFDVDGEVNALVPVIIADCTLDKLIADRAYIDLRNNPLSHLLSELAKLGPPEGVQPLPPATDKLRPYLNVPRGRAVIGRETDLEQLHQTLAANPHAQLTNSAAILAGQGGIGKSTLARAYAEIYHAEYDGTLWLLAATRQNVIDGLMALCGPLGLPVPELAKEPNAQEVLAALGRSNQRWLIIYDNVESYDDFKGLEPPNAHLIATTRQGTGWPGFKVLPTDKLPYDSEDAAAVRLLMDTAERHDTPADAQALAAKLDGLPLALVMAGRLIQRERRSFADYLADITPIIGREPKNEAYQDSVIGAVRLSYDQLSDDAKLVADLFAWWAPEGLEAELISGAPEGQWWDSDIVKLDIPGPVRALAQDDARVRAAMAELQDRSLLTRGEDGAEMHRMAAAALRALQGRRGALDIAKAAAALLIAVYPGGDKPNHSPNWPLCRRLTPHVRALWDSGAAPETAAMHTLLNQSAIYLGKIASFSGMLEMARAALRLKEARLPEEDRAIALAYGTLGGALKTTGDLPGALEAYDRAIELVERYRPGSEDASNAYDLQGGVLVAMARDGDATALPRAAKRYQQALALRRRLFGRQRDPVAEALNNLGAVRSAQGRTAAAARLFGASLAIRRAVLPPGDARLGYGLVGTGAMWLKAGRADLAEPLLDEALEVEGAAYDNYAQHPEGKQTAYWLISCLLTRARAGENTGAREARAKQLCKEFGFDFEEMQQEALQYPYTPDTATP
ncbi:MAG: TIR domain-containing protein [Paracoccaceae bacterium]|nr:TIR domain-containing protein [Paracoccaceae bacterium]